MSQKDLNAQKVVYAELRDFIRENWALIHQVGSPISGILGSFYELRTYVRADRVHPNYKHFRPQQVGKPDFIYKGCTVEIKSNGGRVCGIVGESLEKPKSKMWAMYIASNDVDTFEDAEPLMLPYDEFIEVMCSMTLLRRRSNRGHSTSRVTNGYYLYKSIAVDKGKALRHYNHLAPQFKSIEEFFEWADNRKKGEGTTEKVMPRAMKILNEYCDEQWGEHPFRCYKK